MSALQGWGKDTSPFHPGEQTIQTRLGVRDYAEATGQLMMRSFMPDQHRDFFSQLPFVVLGSIDENGWPFASLVSGKPGFIQSPDNRTLSIETTIAPGDPLKQSARPGAPIGLLGIELHTRRRNRMNATVSSVTEAGFNLSVDISFGNCPQYIQNRAFKFVRPAHDMSQVAAPEILHDFDTHAHNMIRTADTFFVASYAKAKDHSDIDGVDVSHRGGRPGFVRLEGKTLTIPDYSGNRLFNTFGNFAATPKAGLTFVDFETGDLLMLTGTVDMIWDDDPRVKAFRGAERAWSFTLDHAIRLKDALPLRWAFKDYSPVTMITGDWDEAQSTLEAETKRQEWRDYKVVRIADESEVIRSFYLEPTDGGGLISSQAGQHLPIRVTPNGHDEPVLRTYTLSSAPEDKFYRISVKREENGLVSKHLHNTIKEGDLIEARGPQGAFVIDGLETRPAVLIGAGVGITPIISMARHVMFEGARTRSLRPLTIFHAAQTTAQRAFFETFGALQHGSENTIRYFSLIDRPAEGEKAGANFNGVGHLNGDILKQVLPLDDYDFYLCGPPAFMQALYDILLGLGVSDKRIHAESFGPASLKRQEEKTAPHSKDMPEQAENAVIHFTKSGLEQGWKQEDGSLLDFAEAHGLTPNYGCRGGSCGSCAVKLKAGDVTYLNEPEADRENDEVLICCAVPAKGSDRVELEV